MLSEPNPPTRFVDAPTGARCRRHRGRKALRDRVPGIERLEGRVVLSGTDFWTGASGVNDNWMTAGNWQGNTAPVAGDTLIFPLGPGRHDQ